MVTADRSTGDAPAPGGAWDPHHPPDRDLIEDCIHCGFCEMFGCEMGAKSSTLVAMIPDAVATGRCEIRPNSYVR